MKKFTLVLLSALITGVVAAQEPAQKCGSDIILQQEMAKNPLLAAQHQQFLNDLQYYLANNPQLLEKNSSGVRIIPVVFHIIHDGGPENISKAQVLDQVRILNEDYRRLNPDTVNTPEAFDSVAADSRVEFRLANFDPEGKCTDGIVRVQSKRTSGASNENGVKALSYWDRNKYLNIWVVQDIGTESNLGTVIGYAQFPLGGATATDGVVLTASWTGSIGTSTHRGRTATHEVGHWLGLRHIWGDSECGNDGIADTPVHKAANFGCFTFPKINDCAGGDTIRGEMFMNYMDYSDDYCMNMFSKGQNAVMDFTLEGPADSIPNLLGFRENLWSASNLAATGALNDPQQPCAPIADFFANRQMICEGASVNFTDNSYNATVTSRQWTIEGANNTSPTTANPAATFATAGKYDVTLESTNGNGASTVTKNDYIIVSSTTADRNGQNWFAEDFEDENWFFNKFIVFNDDNNQFKWQHTYSTGASGAGSAMVNNYGNFNGAIEELITPSYNLSGIADPVSLHFKYSCTATDTSFDGTLRVYYSINCGQTWTARKTITGAPLANAGLFSSPYVAPYVTFWTPVTVDLPTNVGNNSNVRFKFEFTSKGGVNNLYLDDINITDPTAVTEDLASAINLNLFPNPSNGNGSMLTFNVTKTQMVHVELTDMVGRKVADLYNGQMGAGKQAVAIGRDVFNAAGVYFVRIQIDGQTAVKKLVVAQQ